MFSKTIFSIGAVITIRTWIRFFSSMYQNMTLHITWRLHYFRTIRTCILSYSNPNGLILQQIESELKKSEQTFWLITQTLLLQKNVPKSQGPFVSIKKIKVLFLTVPQMNMSNNICFSISTVITIKTWIRFFSSMCQNVTVHITWCLHYFRTIRTCILSYTNPNGLILQQIESE